MTISYTVCLTNNNKSRNVVGTMAELNVHFSNSGKSKNGNTPSSIKQLVANLQNSFAKKEAACYLRTFVSLV